MKAFTICSNNYLAEAITLGHSLTKNGLPATDFLIFLVDNKPDAIDYTAIPFSVQLVNTEMVPLYQEIVKKYKIVELSTSVKPSIFKYLIKMYPANKVFMYFDPDLFFYNEVQLLEKELGDHSILLTPHIMQPVPMGHDPFENVFLSYGIYNLGFLAVNADENTIKMLDWWEERTIHLGFDAPARGLFVDQLWMNFVPVFFKNVKLSLHTGLNVSYWNMRERVITGKNGKYTINNTDPLVFYHFSSFDITLKRLTKRDYVMDNAQEPAIREMMAYYKKELLANQYEFYKKFPPYYRISFDKFMEYNLPARITPAKLKMVKLLRIFIPPFLMKRMTNLHKIIHAIDSYKKVV